jgi:hypothetical protein
MMMIDRDAPGDVHPDQLLSTATKGTALPEYAASQMGQWLSSLQIGDEVRVLDDARHARYGVAQMLERQRGEVPTAEQVETLMREGREPYMIERLDSAHRSVHVRDTSGDLHSFNTVNGKLARHGSAGMFSFAARLVPDDYDVQVQSALAQRVNALSIVVHAVEQGNALSADERARAQAALDEIGEA